MITAIGYIRVSTDHQDLERQKMLIKKFCEERGYILIRLIEDFGISGADAERAGYLELQALTEDSCDIIVVSELARLSREDDVMKTLTTIYGLMAKFDLIMLDDLATIYKKGSKFEFMQFIGLAFKAYGASEERKKIAERMKTGKYSLIARFPLACLDSTEPLGFKKVPNPEYDEKCKGVPQSLYEVDEEEATIVRNIFTWAAEGLSTHKIADKLHNLGIKSQWGKQIGHSYVVCVLKQPLYKGIRVYKGIEYPTGIEIVSPELWEQAQLVQRENRTRADKYIVSEELASDIIKGLFKAYDEVDDSIVTDYLKQLGESDKLNSYTVEYKVYSEHQDSLRNLLDKIKVDVTKADVRLSSYPVIQNGLPSYKNLSVRSILGTVAIPRMGITL